MTEEIGPSPPVMRLFEARAKAGCIDILAEKLATVSIGVVRGQPGNRGYTFGRDTADGADVVIFASFWDSLEAVKQRFGSGWQSSHLPEGYADLIDDCSVRHIALSGGYFDAIASAEV